MKRYKQPTAAMLAAIIIMANGGEAIIYAQDNSINIDSENITTSEQLDIQEEIIEENKQQEIDSLKDTKLEDNEVIEDSTILNENNTNLTIDDKNIEQYNIENKTEQEIKIKNISVNKPIVKEGQNIIVSIELENDYKDINYIHLKYSNMEYADMGWYNETTGKYEVKIKASEIKLEEEKIILEYIDIIDENYKSHIINDSSILKNGNYIIQKDMSLENQKPIIEKIYIDKKEIISDETAKIYIKLNEDKAKYIDVVATYNLEYYDLEYGYSKDIILTKNKDGIFEGYINLNKEKSIKDITEEDFIHNLKLDKITFKNEYGVTKQLKRIEIENAKDMDLKIIEKGRKLPTVKDIYTDKKIVKENQYIKVGISIDSSAAIYTVVYEDPKGREYEVHVYDEINIETYSEGYIYINKYTAKGKWRVKYVRLNDSKYNEEDICIYNKETYPNEKYTANFNNAEFEVIGDTQEIDNKAPELIDVKVDKINVNTGEKIKLIVDAKDDLSGIEHVEVFIDNMGSYKLTYNKLTKKYETELIIDKYMTGGKYWVEDILLIDNAGNENWIMQNNDSNVYFEVKNILGNTINKGEIIESVSVSNNNPVIGEIVDLKIKAPKDYKLILYYASMGAGIQFKYNDKSRMHEASIKIDKEFSQGTIRASSIRAIPIGKNSSNQGFLISNEKDFDDLDRLNLKVKVDEYESPKLENISINKKEYTSNEKVKITIDAYDKSGINSIVIKYETPKVGYDKYVEFKKVGNVYEGIIDIGEYSIDGLWRASEITMEDELGNSCLIERCDYDLSKIDFKVIGTKKDVVKPILRNISIEKDTIIPGEKVKVTLDAIDSESGIDKISMELLYLEYSIDVEFKLNERTGLYEGYIDMDSRYLEELGSCKMYIYRLYITDKSGNKTILRNDQLKGDRSIYAICIDNINEKSTSIDGYARYSGSLIRINILDKDGNYTGEKYIGRSIDERYFSIPIEPQPVGTKIEVIMEDEEPIILEVQSSEEIKPVIPNEEVEITNLKIKENSNNEIEINFDLNGDIDLSEESNDNLQISFINKIDNNILYILDKTNIQIPQIRTVNTNKILKEGNHTFKINKDKLNGVELENIKVELKIIKNGLEKVTTVEKIDTINPTIQENPKNPGKVDNPSQSKPNINKPLTNILGDSNDPKTGDTGVFGYIGLGITSLAGIFINLKEKRKKK